MKLMLDNSIVIVSFSSSHSCVWVDRESIEFKIPQNKHVYVYSHSINRYTTVPVSENICLSPNAVYEFNCKLETIGDDLLIWLFEYSENTVISKHVLSKNNNGNFKLIFKTKPNHYCISLGFRLAGNGKINFTSSFFEIKLFQCYFDLNEIWKSIHLGSVENNELNLSESDVYQLLKINSETKRHSSNVVNGVLDKYHYLSSTLKNIEKLNCSADELGSPLNYQIDLLRKGQFSCVCPTAGCEIACDKSFYVEIRQRNGVFMPIIFYHFFSVNQFYLVTGLHQGEIIAIYFPLSDFLIELDQSARYVDINKLKSLILSEALLVRTYLKNNWSGDQKIGILCGTDSHFGHFLLNELSATSWLLKNCDQYLENVKSILIGKYEFFNTCDILNSCCENKGISAERLETAVALNRFIIKNNLLALRLSNSEYYLSAKGASAVIKSSIDRVKGSLGEDYQLARSCYPLIWFEVRSNDRVWSNQVDEIVNIGNELRENFPKVGIVIAGWSRPLNSKKEDELLVNSDSMLYEKISDLLSVASFKVVGKSIYEKFVWADLSNIHVATYGSGLFFAGVTKKPTIIHANTGWYPESSIRKKMSGMGIDSRLVWIVPAQHIRDDSDDHYSVRNYHCSGIAILETILNILNSKTGPMKV